MRGITEEGKARAAHLGGKGADELRRGEGAGRRGNEGLRLIRVRVRGRGRGRVRGRVRVRVRVRVRGRARGRG